VSLRHFKELLALAAVTAALVGCVPKQPAKHQYAPDNVAEQTASDSAKDAQQGTSQDTSQQQDQSSEDTGDNSATSLAARAQKNNSSPATYSVAIPNNPVTITEWFDPVNSCPYLITQGSNGVALTPRGGIDNKGQDCEMN
jgi:hypothetical protein